MIKQHRLVNDAIKKEIEGIHGLQVRSGLVSQYRESEHPLVTSAQDVCDPAITHMHAGEPFGSAANITSLPEHTGWYIILCSESTRSLICIVLFNCMCVVLMLE